MTDASTRSLPAHAPGRAGWVAAALASLVAAAPPAAAQSPSMAQPPAGARMIEIDEFRDLFIGATATFVLQDGSAWGREYYDPNGFGVTFLHEDGECMDGVWRKEGDFYCFDYPVGASCWLTYEIDGGIEVQTAAGQVQRITTVSQGDPISCLPELFSDGGPSLLPTRGAF